MWYHFYLYLKSCSTVIASIYHSKFNKQIYQEASTEYLSPYMIIFLNGKISVPCY